MTGHTYQLPDWWPPKVGDRLRMYENQTDYLCHVVAVFEHDGKHHVAVAWYGKTKQWWHYEVLGGFQAHLGMVWQDGHPRPEPISGGPR